MMAHALTQVVYAMNGLIVRMAVTKPIAVSSIARPILIVRTGTALILPAFAMAFEIARMVLMRLIVQTYVRALTNALISAWAM